MTSNPLQVNQVSKVAPGLTPDQILGCEFNYIAQATFQANEDRARVTTFYLISLGSLVAALVGQFISSTQPGIYYTLFISLFLVLSAFGLLTILQLVRLRQAWFEGIQALNQIKTFYTDNIHTVKLGDAFCWQPSQLPARFKPWSISFMLALQVALVSGTSLGAAVLYIGRLGGLIQPWEWITSIVAGIIYVAIEMSLYWRLLQKTKKN